MIAPRRPARVEEGRHWCHYFGIVGTVLLLSIGLGWLVFKLKPDLVKLIARATLLFEFNVETPADERVQLDVANASTEPAKPTSASMATSLLELSLALRVPDRTPDAERKRQIHSRTHPAHVTDSSNDGI